MDKIRNFSIIAHIDHGKSTLADRMLEVTKTIEKRKMRDQVLDRMDLERERGITIKMQPVRMEFEKAGQKYILNLIDTPGHIDFSYEVSRALKAVEGSILLVDATQGVQAQTLTTLGMARDLGLVIVPVVSKVDSPLARTSEVKEEISKLLDFPQSEILEVSGKTGQGVAELLSAMVDRIPAPKPDPSLPANSLQALVFDFQYSNHKGIVVYVRVFSGQVSKGLNLSFAIADEKFIALETGIFSPDDIPVEKLSAGEIGYIVTGIKRPGVASVGDTVTSLKNPSPALPGYQNPRPVVWASVYPESQDDFDLFRQALDRLKLTDASLSFEEESSGTLGRGFRCGFLGMLHLEIITERLHREFNLNLVVTTPTITYKVTERGGKSYMVYSPSFFPEYGVVADVEEPWVKANIILPTDYLSALMPMFFEHEAEVAAIENFGDDRASVTIELPLRELMRNFFDDLKSVSSGYASLSYEFTGMRKADVTRLDILVAEEPVVAFARVVSTKRAEEEAEKAVERLYNSLPKQQFVTKIQARGMGRIISSKTLSALKKDVTGHLYGGDITRKRKLWEKQKKGKKRLKEQGKVNIPQETFLKMVRSN